MFTLKRLLSLLPDVFCGIHGRSSRFGHNSKGFLIGRLGFGYSFRSTEQAAFLHLRRPVPGWADGTPTEILAELTEPEHEGWTHWFFTFDDNWGIPEEKKKQIIESVPAGTKLWKNKIKGLRGRATGLVFSNFDRKKHVVSKEWAKQFTEERIRKLPPSREKYAERFLYFSAACDTAYSQQSPDTIAMSFLGITNFGKCILLDERVYNNAELGTPLAPSDTVRNLLDFLERNRREWGFAKDVFIDSADQATITECIKHKRLFGSIYNFLPSWKKEKIIDRINVQLGWFAEGAGGPYFYVVDSCAACTSWRSTAGRKIKIMSRKTAMTI